MGQVRISIQTAENGVYFTHDGKTFLFTDPVVLGDHLFDLAMDAQDKPNEYNVSVAGVDPQFAIRQIKAIRAATGYDLKSSKDICDGARATGRCIMAEGMDEAWVTRCKQEFASMGAEVLATLIVE